MKKMGKICKHMKKEVLSKRVARGYENWVV